MPPTPGSARSARSTPRRSSDIGVALRQTKARLAHEDHEREELASRGDFLGAQRADKRISQLKEREKSLIETDRNVRQYEECRRLEEEYREAEAALFRDYQDDIDEVDHRALELLEELKEKHREEEEQLLTGTAPPKIHFSKEVLALRDRRDKLSKQRQYDEAHRVQKHLDKLERKETLAVRDKHRQKLELQEKRLSDRHRQEIEQLLDKAERSKSQQYKYFKIELQRLRDKYKRLGQDLDHQHAMERAGMLSPAAASPSPSQSPQRRSPRRPQQQQQQQQEEEEEQEQHVYEDGFGGQYSFADGQPSPRSRIPVRSPGRRPNQHQQQQQQQQQQQYEEQPSQSWGEEQGDASLSMSPSTSGSPYGQPMPPADIEVASPAKRTIRSPGGRVKEPQQQQYQQQHQDYHQQYHQQQHQQQQEQQSPSKRKTERSQYGGEDTGLSGFQHEYGTVTASGSSSGKRTASASRASPKGRSSSSSGKKKRSTSAKARSTSASGRSTSSKSSGKKKSSKSSSATASQSFSSSDVYPGAANVPATGYPQHGQHPYFGAAQGRGGGFAASQYGGYNGAQQRGYGTGGYPSAGYGGRGGYPASFY